MINFEVLNKFRNKASLPIYCNFQTAVQNSRALKLTKHTENYYKIQVRLPMWN